MTQMYLLFPRRLHSYYTENQAKALSKIVETNVGSIIKRLLSFITALLTIKVIKSVVISTFIDIRFNISTNSLLLNLYIFLQHSLYWHLNKLRYLQKVYTPSFYA